MAGDDDQHRRKGKASMTEEQLLKELEEKERRERLAATMQMIGQMTKDDLEKVNKRVNDLLYDIEIPQLWQEMHAADRLIKPEEKPVEQPVQFLQNKRSFDLFKDDEEEEKFWEVHAKKMRLAEREAMKKENDSDASEDEGPAALFGYTESELRVMIEDFRQDERYGINAAVLAQKTDSEADDEDEDEEEEEERFDEEQEGSGEEEEGSDDEEEGSDEEEDESDDSDSE